MRPPAHASPEPGNAWLTIPNLLSLARLAATPILVWLILSERRVVAVVLLALMGFTDWLDGQIARRTGQITELGILLDPVSDRILIMTMIVALMVSGDLPWWLGSPVLARDAALSLTFLVLARRGFGRPKVRRIGKTATFALLSALPALLIGGVLDAVGIALFAIGGVLYFMAGYRYALDVRDWMLERRAPFA